MSLRDVLQSALGDAYYIERELGGGGMSRVFVAQDRALERRVVVKVLPKDLAASVSIERFKREILLGAGLQHPHIVGVFSSGEADGLPFFIMPFVDGESLAARLQRERRLPVREAVAILRDVARALAFAHERGVVHRDIKPANVLLTAGSATVTDFGVAKALSTARRSGDSGDGFRVATSGGETPSTGGGDRITSTGTSLGTLLYMAPEQAAGDPRIDGRADIYAFGITAYEMLTGAPPFAGLGQREMLTARLTSRPPRIATVRGDVSPELEQLIMKCLAPDPADRPQTAAELLQVLEDPAAARETRPGRLLPVAPQSRRILILACTALAVLVVAGVLWAVAARRGRIATAASPLAPGAAAAAAARGTSVAVVPFVDIGHDSASAYLGDGLATELASALARLPNVRVLSPSRVTSVLASGGAGADPGKALGVTMLLEGTVQRAGKQLRVTARLSSVGDGVMVWSDIYERQMTDVLAMEDDLSRSIVSAVSDEVAPGAQGAAGARGATAAAGGRAPGVASAPAATRDAGAYDLYLRGGYLVQQRGEHATREGIALFQRAAARDPRFGTAFTALADAYLSLAQLPQVRRDSVAPLALSALDSAIALGAGSADVFAARARVLGMLRRWSQAEADFRRAIAADAQNGRTHQWFAEALAAQGRVSEAMAEAKRAVDVEPYSATALDAFALTLGLARRDSDAIAAARRALDLDSSLPLPHYVLGWLLLGLKRDREALEQLELATVAQAQVPAIEGVHAMASAAVGDKKAATLMAVRLDSLARAGRGYAAAAALAQLGLGDRPAALHWLDRAADLHDGFLDTMSLRDRLFDPVRSDPGFRPILAKLGLDQRLLTATP